MFFSDPYLLSTSPIYFGSLSSPIFIVIAHVFAPRYRSISPSPPSHCSHNAKKPSPPSHRWSKLHRHCLHRTQERCGFRGWISWLWLDFMGFFGFRGFLWVSWKEGILVWICVWFQSGFEFVIWFWVCGLGIGGFGNGYQWLVAVGWVGFCSGFQFVSQWVSMDFSCVLQWVLMGSGVGWVSNGGGGLGIMLMVVICVVVFG